MEKYVLEGQDWKRQSRMVDENDSFEWDCEPSDYLSEAERQRLSVCRSAKTDQL